MKAMEPSSPSVPLPPAMLTVGVVATTAAGPATVADELLLSRRQRDRHRIGARRPDLELPAHVAALGLAVRAVDAPAVHLDGLLDVPIADVGALAEGQVDEEVPAVVVVGHVREARRKRVPLRRRRDRGRGAVAQLDGVVLVGADGPLSPAGQVAGQRDRHRIVAVRVDGDQPAVALSVVAAGAGHVAVRDRECVVAHRGGGDRDVVREGDVEGERRAAVVVLRDVLEAAGQDFCVEDGAGSPGIVVDIRALSVEQV